MSNWFEKTILDGIKELDEEKSCTGWFPINAISNIPYIKYPFLSDEQNEEIYEQAKQVLILSRTRNQYKETSITYNIDETKDSTKYVKVFGGYNTIHLMDDKEVNALITAQNENNNLVIVSLHNHSNNSGFSAMDILIFANNPNIKIMEILNTKGEVSILARPSELDLRHEMINILVLNIPDIAVRMNQWKKENPNDIDKLSLVDITTVDERNNIATDCINTFTNLGIFYSNYVDQEKAKHLTFPTIKTITNEEKK